MPSATWAFGPPQRKVIPSLCHSERSEIFFFLNHKSWIHQPVRLEGQANAELGREWNPDRRSRAEEIPQGSGRHAQLIEADNRHGTSWCGAERSGIEKTVDRDRQSGDISDVVGPRVIAVE